MSDMQRDYRVPIEELPHVGELSVGLGVDFGADPALWGYLPAGTDPQPIADRLAAALNAALKETVPEFSLRLHPEVRVTVDIARIIPTLAERVAEEEGRRVAGPEVVDEPCGHDGRMTRTGSYLRGYHYQLDGRPYTGINRCGQCGEYGCFTDSCHCEGCEEVLAAAVRAAREKEKET